LLLGTLIESELLDELCLTVAPILVGGAAKRIVTGIGHVHTKMRRSPRAHRRRRLPVQPLRARAE
jgi:riboflavin biosynthesis pyrimidine reductase